jgi:HEAT repeat protein
VSYELTGGALVALSVTVAVLFALTLGFSSYAVMLRVAYERRQRLWTRLSTQWEPLVLAAITDPSAFRAVHAAVPERYRLYFVNFVLDYSQRVRGEELQVLHRLAEPYLDEIARRARHARAEVRLRSVQTLGALGLPTYEATVVAALDDPSRSVAIVALRALADTRYSEHSATVLDHVQRFEGWEPSFLGGMLAEVGPAASAALREGLADERRPAWVRSVFAIALRIQLDPRAADVAASVLPSVEDLDLRLELLRVLREVGRPDHVPVVLPLITSGSFAVRAYAHQVLGVIGDETVIDTLRRGLDDPSPWVCARAAAGLLAVGGRRLLTEIASAEPRHGTVIGQVLSAEAG